MNETAMCWGIDCGSGWYQLIYDLSVKLEKLIQDYINKNSPLPCSYCLDKKEDHNESGCNKVDSSRFLNNGVPTKCSCKGYEPFYPRASQVKEKYGTLRFYMSSGTHEMWDLIDAAEEKSERICEDCGKTAAETSADDWGWLTTLCGDCKANRHKDMIQ